MENVGHSLSLHAVTADDLGVSGALTACAPERCYQTQPHADIGYVSSSHD